jgi:hypothetical protein
MGPDILDEAPQGTGKKKHREVSLCVTSGLYRAFIHAREIVAEHFELRKRLEIFEMKVARGFEDNEDELNAIRPALQQLMMPIDATPKNPIGFGRGK